MQDRPNAQELVGAVAGFLSNEIVPTVSDPRLRFRVLIAANVLGIVARELGAGEGPLVTEWQRLVTLLDEDAGQPPARAEQLRTSVTALNAELCARIRAGEADAGEWRSAVLDHVEQTVIEKLHVANPKYVNSYRRDA